MPAGILRERVTLQERDPDATPNDYNEATENWRDLLPDIPAEVYAFASREYVAAQQTQNAVTHRVTIRTPTRVIVQSVHRFVWIERLIGGTQATHYLDIKQVAPLRSRRGYTECVCVDHG